MAICKKKKQQVKKSDFDEGCKKLESKSLSKGIILKPFINLLAKSASSTIDLRKSLIDYKV